MRGDSDKFNPDVSQDKMLAKLKEAKLGINGFHIGFEDRFLFPFLLERLEPNANFPIQIASGPLLSMRECIMYSPSPELKELMDTRRIQLFIHLPFVINPYKDPGFNSYVTKYLTKLGSIYSDGNVSYIMHCSYPGKIDHAYSNFQANLTCWQKLSKNRILLENLVGSAYHPEDYSSPMVLWDHFINPNGDFFCDEGRLGLCVDTEHAWGQGIDYPTLVQFINEHSKDIFLIHWNAAPESASFGKHIDMHSFTSFKLDLSRKHMWTSHDNPGENCYDYDDFNYIVSELRIPTVFERSHLSIQIADLPCFVLE